MPDKNGITLNLIKNYLIVGSVCLLIGGGVGMLIGRSTIQPAANTTTEKIVQNKVKKTKPIPKKNSIPEELNTPKLKELYIKASKGDPEAQCLLGDVYYDGEEVEQNAPRSVSWYKKAANQNHAEAQYCLGWHYLKGLGIRRDDDEAFKWHKKAAEQGHVKSQYLVAFAYEVGTDFGASLPKNEKEAVKWYRKAAEQGHADAMICLARHFMDGEGIEKSYEEAERWLLKVKQKGKEEEVKEALQDLENRKEEDKRAEEMNRSLRYMNKNLEKLETIRQ